MQRTFQLVGILFLLVAASVQIGCTAQSPLPAPDNSEEGFVALFNGEDLTGWEGGEFNIWKVEDGMLVGRSPGIEHNDFLATGTAYENFILKFSFRLLNGEGNSGMQFRSRRVPNSHEVSGYQADIGGRILGLTLRRITPQSGFSGRARGRSGRSAEYERLESLCCSLQG